MYRDIFEHASFYLFWVSVRRRRFRLPKTKPLENLSRVDLLKTPFLCCRVDGCNRRSLLSLCNCSEVGAKSFGAF